LLTQRLPWSLPKQLKNTKEELIKSQEQNEHLTALVGKVTIEKEWLIKKLKSLGSSKLKQLRITLPKYLNRYRFTERRKFINNCLRMATR